jgi:hypothetical protein
MQQQQQQQQQQQTLLVVHRHENPQNQNSITAVFTKGRFVPDANINH